MEPKEVSRSFIRQLTRQIKRDERLSQAKAQDKAVQKYGFANYRHYLNHCEKNETARLIERNEVVNSLKFTSDDSQKLGIALKYVRSRTVSIHDLVLLLRHIKSRSDVHLICVDAKIENQLQELVETYFFSKKSKEIIQDLPLMDHFEASKVKVSYFGFGYSEGSLFVECEYLMSFKFLYEVPEELKNEPNFSRPTMFGNFELFTDGNKSELKNVSIGSRFDNQMVMVPFRKIKDQNYRVSSPSKTRVRGVPL